VTARRGRLVLVGDGTLATRLRPSLVCGVEIAADLFDALAMIAESSLRDPVAALFISLDRLPASSASIPEAVRRLDPAVEIVGVRTRAEECDAPPPQWLDAVWEPPFPAGALREILDPAYFAAAESAGSPAPANAAISKNSAAAPLAPIDLRSAPSSRHGRRDEPASGRGAQSAAPLNPSPPSSPAPRASSVTNAFSPTGAGRDAPDTAPMPAPKASASLPRLGDIDLVRALLSETRVVRETAQTLLRQQTGWSDLTLNGDAPHDQGCAVVHDSVTYGFLSSKSAGPKQLAPWAAWLGHWLALEAKFAELDEQAHRDELTGAWNRRSLHQFLHSHIPLAASRRRPVTVMVFDIDDFKSYNDRFGHDAGDTILRETVALLQSVIRKGDRVFRIGGDEFAVIFADLEAPREPGSTHPETVEGLADRVRQQIRQMRFPKLGLDAPGTLSISAGLATFPWDSHEAGALLCLADQRAMESKRRGKNGITFGPTA